MDALLTVLKITFMVTSCQARILSAPRHARHSLAEPMPYYYYNNIDGHPGTYSYGYDVSDPATGNSQYKTEERYPNGTVIGSYGYVDPYGRPQRYRYVADERGYRVMRDSPKKPYVSQTTTSPGDKRGNIPTESSVTWTRRPKNPKNKINKGNSNKFTEKINYPVNQPHIEYLTYS